MTTLWELRQSAIAQLDEYFVRVDCAECKGTGIDVDRSEFDNKSCFECNGEGTIRDFGLHPEDSVHEIADSMVPVYTSDLMQIAADNLDMATLEPELGPAFGGDPTPANIVAANIYEYLSNELHQTLHEMRETA